MASAVGVRLIMEQPVKTIETIFRGTDVVLGCCRQISKTRADPEHVRSLRQRHLGSLQRRRRSAHRCDRQAPLGLRVCKDARRVSRPRPLQRDALARRRRSAFQYRRPASDRPIRNGRAAFCRGSVKERADRGPRRRNAIAMLWPRRDVVDGLTKMIEDASVLRPGNQPRQRRRGHHKRSSPKRRSR